MPSATMVRDAYSELIVWNAELAGSDPDPGVGQRCQLAIDRAQVKLIALDDLVKEEAARLAEEAQGFVDRGEAA